MRYRTEMTTVNGCKHRWAHFGEVGCCCLVQTLVDQHTYIELYSLPNKQPMLLIPKVSGNAIDLKFVQYDSYRDVE